MISKYISKVFNEFRLTNREEAYLYLPKNVMKFVAALQDLTWRNMELEVWRVAIEIWSWKWPFDGVESLGNVYLESNLDVFFIFYFICKSCPLASWFSNKICLTMPKGFSQLEIFIPKECPPTSWFSSTPMFDGTWDGFSPPNLLRKRITR